MKSMVKLVGLFLLLYVGNVSMALPELKEVCEGDDVTFNLGALLRMDGIRMIK